MTGPSTVFARTIAALRDPASTYARRLTGSGGLDLDIGEARFPLPAPVRAEIAAAVGGLERPWYSSPQGEEYLRDDYLAQIGRPKGAAPVEVMVTAGGKEAAWLAVSYALEMRGAARAALPCPGWEPYSLWLSAAGCPVTAYDPLRLAADPDYLAELADSPGPALDLLVINYPHNPTGALMDQHGYDRLLALAGELGIAVVSDEVYRAFAPGPASALAAPGFDAAKDVVVDSCSKSLGAAGLRVGFLASGRRTVADLVLYRSSYASCTSILTQTAAAALMSGPAGAAWLAEVRARVAADRQAVADLLAQAGVKVTSHGGLYLWCQVPDLGGPDPEESAEWARLADGAGFGVAGHVRICTARADLDPAAVTRAILASLRDRER